MTEEHYSKSTGSQFMAVIKNSYRPRKLGDVQTIEWGQISNRFVKGFIIFEKINTHAAPPLYVTVDIEFRDSKQEVGIILDKNPQIGEQSPFVGVIINNYKDSSNDAT